MTADLTTKYDLRVPRYTSYPTAPHFSEAVDGAVYQRWLGELGPDVDLSLYFHIPFCAEMCWFCGCYTKIVHRYEPVQQYLETLLKEIDLVADALPGRFKVRHLHWGGGSPTMLKGPDWLRIFDTLRRRFDIDAEEEIAVELDPRTATEDYVEALATAGVNRASIGVQDFHPEVQKAIHRVQPYEITERVVGLLRKHGIRHINMDLLYGLPHQTDERVRDMVDLAVKLKPARVALFGYAHVPWMKTHQKMIDESALPGAAERWRQFNAASARMVELGYVPIGLDHFALPDDKLAVALRKGCLHRNFQGYTVDAAGALLGFGASAIGSLPQGYVQNVSPLKPYRESTAAGSLPVARGVAYSGDDRVRGEIIERLMCDLAVDVDAVSRRHGATAKTFDAEMAALAPLSEDGIIDVAESQITITDAGRPYVRVVAATFDRYLKKGEVRHSRAV